jgi:hypothetical protein
MTDRHDFGGDWSEYQRWVMESLKELKDDAKEAKNQLSDIRTEIAMLKLKSSFWGAVSGLMAYAILWGAEFLRRRP